MLNERKWFAVYTISRHEKSVAKHLLVRNIEYFLPLCASKHKWKNGQNVVVELPLFPSYIFVHIGTDEWRSVQEAPGVLTLLGGSAHKESVMLDEEIQALRDGLFLRQAEPHSLLRAGQRARILTGALAGLEGVVVRENNSLRVVLTVDAINSSYAVEVDADELLYVEP
jgi:transcription antitermination factor NusG